MIIFGCCILCVFYILATMSQDFYHAWKKLIPAAAAFYIALWSMPTISAMLEKLFAEGDLRLLQPFCKSAAILLIGAAVLIVMWIIIGKIAPFADPEIPLWLDRPASFAARAVTALMILLLLLQCGLVLPMAATFGGFRSTAEKADAIALFTSRVLNRLSGQSSRNEQQRKALAKLRAFSQQEAERVAQREREEQEAREEEQRQAETAKVKGGSSGQPQTPQEPSQAGQPASTPGIVGRTKIKLRSIYDTHNQGLEQEMQNAPGQKKPSKRNTPAPQKKSSTRGIPTQREDAPTRDIPTQREEAPTRGIPTQREEAPTQGNPGPQGNMSTRTPEESRL